MAAVNIKKLISYEDSQILMKSNILQHMSGYD